MVQVITPVGNTLDVSKLRKLNEKSKQVQLLEKQEQFKTFNMHDLSRIPFPLGGKFLLAEPRITFNDAGRTLCHTAIISS